jgi:S-adenosylmethionine decarboxylase
MAQMPERRHAMRDLAPDITRQRLLIEGRYERELDAEAVARYLVDLAAELGLRTYGQPIVHAPAGAGKHENQGFDAFIPLIDSGISLYVWTGQRFFAAVLFTCKRFEVEAALAFTRTWFRAAQTEHCSF